MRSLSLYFLLAWIAPNAFGQTDMDFPQGNFMADSVKIGEHIQYMMSFEYPAQAKILFPDSTYNFFPFEYVGKEYFPTTTTREGMLKDSIVFTLATYELDEVYYLRVPVYFFEGKDSSSFYSTVDSVRLKPVVTSLPKNPELLAETDFQEVPKQFNYIYFLIGIGVLLIVLTTLVLLFGKKVYRMFVVYRLKKSFEKYKAEYHSILTQKSEDAQVSERALTAWKKYLEKLDRQPITKLTTKEITQVYPNNDLKNTLREIDRSLYGGIQVKNMEDMFDSLEKFSFERLNLKIEEVNNG